MQGSQAITMAQIVQAVGMSRFAIQRRDISGFACGQTPTSGRPQTLYKPAVVGYLIQRGNTPPQPTTTPHRSDRGTVRGRNAELVEFIVRRTLQEFLSSGVKDLRSACCRALHWAGELVQAGKLEGAAPTDLERITLSWLYKNHLLRKRKGKDGSLTLGPFHAENWEGQHNALYRRWDTATASATTSYCNWKIFENDFGAGAGHGFGRWLMLDDRSADVWTRSGDKYTLQYGVYVWCVLTGALMYVEPAETVSAQTYIRAIMATHFLHGLSERTVYFMENSKAAVADRVQHVIAALQTREDQHFFATNKAHKLLCNGAGAVVRNTPHIPKSFGKAFGERRFGLLKKEYDAAYYPDAFHGGGLWESVQLTRAKMPMLTPSSTATVDEYFRGVLAFSYSEYLDRERGSLSEWAEGKGLKPTIRAMRAYYSPKQAKPPTEEQFAQLLFWATNKPNRIKLKTPGSVQPTIGGRLYNLVHPELYQPGLKGEHLTTIPVPGRPNHCAIYLYDQLTPRFLCVAEDMTARSAEDANRMRSQARTWREQHISSLESAAAAARGDTDLAAERRQALNHNAAPSMPQWHTEAAEIPPANLKALTEPKQERPKTLSDEEYNFLMNRI